MDILNEWGRTALKVEVAFGARTDDPPEALAWTDVSADLLDQRFTIKRGRPNEGSQLVPSTASLTLDNALGQYTPGLRSGAHWPNVRRGTPCRIWALADSVHMDVPPNGNRGNVASTPHTAAMNVAGALDVRVDVALDAVPAQNGATLNGLVEPWDQVGEFLAGSLSLVVPVSVQWALAIDAQGRLEFVNGALDGSFFTSERSTVPVPYGSGQRFTARAVYNPNDAGAHSYTFYTGPSVDGPWTMLGQPVVQPTTLPLPTGVTEPLRIGAAPGQGYLGAAGSYYRFQMRNGAGGPLVVDVDLTAQQVGATSFVDGTGLTWTLQQDVTITDLARRLVGTIDSWEPTWPWGDLTQVAPDPPRPGESRCRITIAGPLRRIIQGASTEPSTLRRRVPFRGAVAYWPLEDGPLASQAASGLVDGQPLAVTGLDFGAASGLPGSRPLPVVEETGATLRASVPVTAPTSSSWQVEFVYRLNAFPSQTEQLLQVTTTGGPYNAFQVRVTTTGLELYGIPAAPPSNPVQLLTVLGTDFLKTWNRFQLHGQDDGGGQVRVGLTWVTIGGARRGADATYAGTPGQVSGIATAITAGLRGLAIGHLCVFPVVDTSALDGADNAFDGERAVTRIARIARESGLNLTVWGDPAASEQMGPQPIADRWSIVQDCAKVDGGMLSERRTMDGFQYRPRDLLYNMPPTTTVDAQLSQIANPFVPVLDDQRIRNDVTVQRQGGSSAQAVDQESIDTEGRYEQSLTLNAHSDEQLADLAAHQLSLAVGDVMRYSSVTGDLLTADLAVPEWMALDGGSRVQVTGLPPQHPDQVVDLLAEGYTETLGPAGWEVTATCSPYRPWESGTAAGSGATDPPDAEVRADTELSLTGAAIDATATTIQVYTPEPERPWVVSGTPVDAGPVLNPNPSFEVNTTGWSNNGSTIARVAVPTPQTIPTGAWCLQVTPNGTAQFPGAYANPAISVSPGRTFRAAAWVRCGRARGIAVGIDWYKAGNVYITSSVSEQGVQPNVWQYITVTGTAPAEAVGAVMTLGIPNTPPATDVAWFDLATFQETVTTNYGSDFPFDLQLGLGAETARATAVETVSDSFTRTAASGWGSTASGQAWTTAGGAAADYWVSGASASMRLTAAPGPVLTAKLPPTVAETDVTADVTTDQMPTGGSLLGGVILRENQAGSRYAVRLHFGTTGVVLISATAGNVTSTSITVPGVTYAAGMVVRLRARVVGTLIEAKAWLPSQPEPAAWQFSYSAPTIIATGRPGCLALKNSGNTNTNPTVIFSRFQLTMPQLFTVQRGVDGPAAAHPAGTDVRLADPAYVTL